LGSEGKPGVGSFSLWRMRSWAVSWPGNLGCWPLAEEVGREPAQQWTRLLCFCKASSPFTP